MVLALTWLLVIHGVQAGQPCLAPGTATTSASAPASGPSRPDAWKVCIATLNVYFDNRSPELAVEAIRESKADIVFLQETTPKLEQRLKKELKAAYPHMFFKGGSGKIPTDRFGILSRTPLEKPRFLGPKHGLFGTAIAMTTIDGRRLQLVNVHLKPLQLRSNSPPAQYLQAFKALDKAHEGELTYILKNIDPRMPTIIAGDFNSIPDSSVSRLLAEKGFRDAFKPAAKAGTDGDSGPATWHFDSQLGPIRLRIDYIFYAHDLVAVSGKVISDTGSDHGLVATKLKLDDGDEPATTQPSSNPG